MGTGEMFTWLLLHAHLPCHHPFQADNPVGYLIKAGGAAALIATMVAIINQGSNATHCLYNSVIGWAKILGVPYRTVVLWLGGIGVVLAASGVWKYLLDWLQLIAFLVPPVGATAGGSHARGGLYHPLFKAGVRRPKAFAIRYEGRVVCSPSRMARGSSRPDSAQNP